MAEVTIIGIDLAKRVLGSMNNLGAGSVLR